MCTILFSNTVAKGVPMPRARGGDQWPRGWSPTKGNQWPGGWSPNQKRKNWTPCWESTASESALLEPEWLQGVLSTD